MYLKSIEVHGFKSFANKLVFEFHNGITGIVGPNGSGKSNVADAVRWVLGEQSAKSLRGASMQDVIFAGTETRKPQSYAYVALTITNEDHKLNVPYEEVQIARRVYRSGESEYLLNGATCRLKDVQELFFDTGIGKEGYSIIGQGQVDKILSGKPEERRELFDEAAGIVKFKKRKKKTEKDLEIESQNLLRVNDILDELEKQVGPLEEQSGKAREYLKLKEELKSYEINLFLKDYENFNEELKDTTTNIDNANAELNNTNLKQEEMKNSHREVEDAVTEFNTRLDKNKNQLNESKLLLGKIDSEISLSKQKIESIAQGKEFYSDRMLSLEKTMNDTNEEMDEYKSSMEQANSKRNVMQEKVTEKENELASITSRMNEIDGKLSEENQSVYTFMEATSEITGQRQKMESMLEQNEIKKAEISQKILMNKSQVASAVEEMEREEAALNEVKDKLNKTQDEKAELLNKGNEARNKERENRNAMQEKQREYHIESSKLESLRNMTERYDGYGQSIRRVMDQKATNKGIIGVVADIIKVDKKYETAVETALGGAIQNIVTENEQTAKELIGFLKKNRYGRATFLPLTTVSASPGRIKEEVLREPGAIGSVASLVNKQDKFNGLIEYLLGRFVLVDTIDNAMAIARKYHHQLRIVTLDGDQVNPGGSMSGGAYRNSNNLLGRRREMEKLEETIANIKKQNDKLKTTQEKITQEIARITEKLSAKEEQIQQFQIEKNTAQIKYEQAVTIKDEKEVEYNAIANDGKDLESQRLTLAKELEGITSELEEKKNKSQESKENIEKLTHEQEELRIREKSTQDVLAERRQEIASFEQKNQYITENINRIQADLAKYQEEHDSLMEQHSKSDEEVEDLNHQIMMLEEKHAKTKEEIALLEDTIEEDTKNKDDLMEKQKDFFDQLNDIMKHVNDLDKEIFRLNSNKEKLEEQLSKQIDYMWNEYEVTYIGAKEFLLDEDISYTRMKSIVNDTKIQIHRLGAVNVNAIEDYKNVSERYETLKTQHDDLVESETALRKIIEELDEEMRKQFSEKFSEIQVQFNKVFRELFGGGKGTLEIETGEDVDLLEAGIQIIAQPPGKKLQNMMQLSGGERALTAIALLFAIQNLKPSPFCLLDEIEAALDEANVKRYANYLHKLTKNTQFIVITHRQGTMAAVDTLYGITMQEKGVSTLVSVNLIESQLAAENKKKSN